MNEQYYCPECHNPLERHSGCGAVGYLCNTCKKLISRQRILTYEEIKGKSKETKDTGSE